MNYKFVIAALLASTTSFAQIEKSDILIQAQGLYSDSRSETNGSTPSASYGGGYSERGVRLTGTYMLSDDIGVGIGGGYQVSKYEHTEDSYSSTSDANAFAIEAHTRYNVYQKGSFVAFSQLNIGVSFLDEVNVYGNSVQPRNSTAFNTDLDLGVGYLFGKYIYASVEFDLLRYVIGSEEGLGFSQEPFEHDYSRFEFSSEFFRAKFGIGVRL